MMKTLNEVNERIGDLMQDGSELSQYLDWLLRFGNDTESAIEANETIKQMDAIEKEYDKDRLVALVKNGGREA